MSVVSSHPQLCGVPWFPRLILEGSLGLARAVPKKIPRNRFLSISHCHKIVDQAANVPKPFPKGFPEKRLNREEKRHDKAFWTCLQG